MGVMHIKLAVVWPTKKVASKGYVRIKEGQEAGPELIVR